MAQQQEQQTEQQQQQLHAVLLAWVAAWAMHVLAQEVGATVGPLQLREGFVRQSVAVAAATLLV